MLLSPPSYRYPVPESCDMPCMAILANSALFRLVRPYYRGCQLSSICDAIKPVDLSQGHFYVNFTDGQTA